MSKMGGSAKPDKDNPDPQAIMTFDENRAEGHIPNVLLATLTKQYCAEIIQVPTDQGGVWNFFLIRQNRSSNQRLGMILEVQIQSFSTRASKFSFSKNSRRLKYQYFLMKIGTKLPLTVKNKRRNTNLKFEFQNYFKTHQKKVINRQKRHFGHFEN